MITMTESATDLLDRHTVAQIRGRSEETCDALGVAFEQSPVRRLCESHEEMRRRMEEAGVDLTLNF